MKLADVPTTTVRVLVSLGLAICYVVTVLVLMACRVPISTELVIAVGTFILGMLGADVAQFAVKRKTFISGAAGEP